MAIQGNAFFIRSAAVPTSLRPVADDLLCWTEDDWNDPLFSNFIIQMFSVLSTENQNALLTKLQETTQNA